jgi:hypothetical protein
MPACSKSGSWMVLVELHDPAWQAVQGPTSGWLSTGPAAE